MSVASLGNGPGLRITSAVVGSILFVLGAALGVAKALPTAGWVVIALLGLTTILIALREVLAHKESRQDAKKQREAVLRSTPIVIRSADPFSFGVTQSEIADKYRKDAERPPYVTREIDEELDRLLQATPFVAVVGPSKAGKSRTTFEAIFRAYPDRLLIAPEPRSRQEGLADAIAPYLGFSDGVVVWLDDLQDFLQADSLSVRDLVRWREAFPDVAVVATIRDGELAAFRSSEHLGGQVQRIIDMASVLPLPPLLSGKELKDAEEVYPREDFGDGIGVHLVAGQQLVERFVSSPGPNPAGFAFAAASIDRRRAGVSGPATLDELTELAPEYFHQVRPRTKFDATSAGAAIDWATDTVIQDIGLLIPKGPDRDEYEPFEYVVAYRDGEVSNGSGAANIPDRTWERLIARHDGWTLRSIGHSAMSKGSYRAGKRALERLAQDPDPHVAAHGVFDLADACWETGDKDAAVRRYKESCDSPYECVHSKAFYCYALVLDRAVEDPEPWYRRALAFPDSPTYPKALVNLGLLLRTKSNIASHDVEGGVTFVSADRSSFTTADYALENEAQALFERALETSDPEAIRNGGHALGVLHASKEELDEAERALLQSAEAGSEQARIWLIDVISRSPERLPEAWLLLEEAENGSLSEDGVAYLESVGARLAEREGDTEESKNRLRKLIGLDHPHYWEQASLNLARILVHSDSDWDGARSVLEPVAERGLYFQDEAKRRLEDVARALDDG